MSKYELSLKDFEGEVEFYKEYTRRVDRSREMDKWSEYERSIDQRQIHNKNKINDFDSDMAESTSIKK